SALATAHTAQAQTYNVIHKFAAQPDGMSPMGRVVFGQDGSLYGTTNSTVFNLRPSASVCKATQCFWTETILAGGYQALDQVTWFSIRKVTSTVPPRMEAIMASVQPSSSCPQPRCIPIFTPSPDSKTARIPTGVILDAAGYGDGAFPYSTVTMDA